MKTKFLPILLILSGLLVTADKTYACNDPPNADLDASPNPVCVGRSVTLDGSGSSDPDGDITKYEWDWTDDWTYDYEETPGDGIATHIYTIAGTYSAKLRVTDDDDATDTDTCTVYVVKVNYVTEDKTLACVNETITFTAHAYPLGKPLDCIEWEKRYRANSGASWGTWGGASGGDNTAVLNTSTAGCYQYRAWNGSDDTWKESSEVTVVKVDKIQYYDPDNGYTDFTGNLYVCVGVTVTFKAIKKPSTSSWPSGKPVWGGTCGASGSGETTDVTFGTLSSTLTDYKTVTAECGNTHSESVVVADFFGVTQPQDDFTGGSRTRYGIYELVDLDYETDPAGVTASQLGGLRWSKSGSGTLSNVTNNGTALYKAGPNNGSVTLKLRVLTGPSKNKYVECSRTIVEPDDDGACEKRSGTNIWHRSNTFSIGVNTYMYLRPTDVSFKWIKFKEGLCNSQTSGWFNIEFTNKWHTSWPTWIDVGGGDSTKGCKILQSNGDFAELYDYSPFLPYFYGTFLWDIPWKYKAGPYTKTFTYMNQEFKVHSDGKAEVQKDESGWFYNYHGWSTLPY